ncbi:Lipid A export ATP-binding/permease protein MsbA [compost metagenome]
MNLKILLWSNSNLWTKRKNLVISSLLFSLILGCAPYFTLLVTKELLNEISLIINGLSPDYSKVVLLFCFQFIIQILITSLNALEEYYEKKNLAILEMSLKLDVFDKSKGTPLLVFDNPLFHDHFSRINNNIGLKFWSPVKSIFQVIKIVLNLISFSIVLFSIHWVLMIVCIVITIPLFYIYTRLGKAKFDFGLFNTPLNREISYINHILTDREYAKELRVFSLHDYFKKLWSSKYIDFSKKNLELDRKQNTIKIISEATNSIFYIMLSVLIVFLIVQTKKIKIGDFVVINQALISTQTALKQLALIYSNIKESNLYLKDFYDFITADYKKDELEEPNQLDNYFNENDKINSIGFIDIKNVSFKYLNQNVHALKNISFSINEGERVAILGDNGSGKSTLIKCLVGLYSEYSGEVKIHGNEVKNIEENEKRRLFSVIFQDYIKFPYSIKDNIAFSDVENIDDIEKVIRVAKKTGLDSHILKLSEGYQTNLGNFLKKGVDFSGGQWQKLAISRALFKDSPILIFDEPTASLDPLSEVEIYTELFSNSMKNTIIFVSHRTFAARFADKIIVMKEGEIIEQGSHDELMLLKGHYYTLFTVQSNWSRENIHQVGV